MMFFRVLPIGLALLVFPWRSPAQEMRATWLARDSLTSKTALANAMATLASNHFNVVFVNAWSRGYPLWQSQVFSNHTGLAIDPNFASRDILAEAVVEGHRHGLEVYAWFEYGFVGGWSGYLPGKSGKGKIFDTHPDWVATKQNGGQIDASGFYWMIQTHPGPQQLLIDLAKEVVANYDLDGLEFDRIRYSSLEYGYDAHTRSLYESEHNGAAPPAQTNNASWIRWRADKLNAFMARAHGEIKRLNPNFKVANAPSAYSSSSYTSYNSFCQDWLTWLREGSVDHIELQSYFGNATSFSNVLNYVRAQVPDRSRVFPSFAINPNGNSIAPDEMLKFMSVTKAKGFSGNAIWYYVPLTTSNYFPTLKTNVYRTKTNAPLSATDAREHRALALISNPADSPRNGVWESTNGGFEGTYLVGRASAFSTVDYFFEVPESGYYEVYAFINAALNRTTAARYTLRSADGSEVVAFINQGAAASAGWNKLGNVLLNSGRQRVAGVSNQGVTGGLSVSADAILILQHRRLSAPLSLSVNVSPFVVNLQLNGAVGQPVEIQISTNLQRWDRLLGLTLWQAKNEVSANRAVKNLEYFRARLSP